MLVKVTQQVAAAAAAKSLQSRPTLCDPIDSSPPGSSVPGILQARVLELSKLGAKNKSDKCSPPMRDSLNILWHFLYLGLEWKLTFSSPVATAEFSKFAGI